MSSEDQTNDGTSGEQITGTQETTTNNVDLGESINVTGQDTVVGGLNEDTIVTQDKSTDTGTPAIINATPTVIVGETPAVQAPVSDPVIVAQYSQAPAVTAPTLSQQETVVSITEVKVADPVIETKGPLPVSEFDQAINKIKAEGTVHQISLVSSIEQYINAVRPGTVIDFNAGARHQYTFWRAISTMIETAPQEEFKRLWNILLAYFNEYNTGVFAHRYVYRFAEYWSYDESELAAYQRILNLLITTANPAARKASLGKMDLTRALDAHFSESAKSRLISFYQN